MEKLNLTYSYDALDRLSTVKEGATQIAGYTYDQNGNQTSQTFNNGTTSNYTYNKANQILTLSNQKGAAVLSGYAYQYYTDGNAYKITDHNNVVTTYTYDGMGRLKSEAFGSNYSKTYNYDPSNNRSSMVVTGTGAKSVSYDYDDNNRLTKETSVSAGITDEYLYAYDPNGNQVAKTKGSITTTGSGVGPTVGAFLLGGPTASGDYEAEVATYDGFNRLVQIKNNGQTIDYAYRPDDLRHSKTINGVKTTHIWDGDNIVLELDNANQVQNKYLRGNGLIAFDNASVRSYYFRNGHGDVVQLADTTGTVTKNYAYDTFGVETNPVTLDVNPFRYAGEYWDSSSGTYYLRARNYVPETSRMLSLDAHWNIGNMIYGDEPQKFGCRNNPRIESPVDIFMPSIEAIIQSTNGYIYCGNDPVNRLDPFGNTWVDAVIYAQNNTMPDPRNVGAFASWSAGLIMACNKAGTVVTANEGVGDGQRLNAVLTVSKTGKEDQTFTGSTIPDKYGQKDVYKGLNVATLDPGIYEISAIAGGYLNKPAYYVLKLNGEDGVPVTRWAGTDSAYASTGTGIYIHKGANYSPGDGKRWSVGCVLVDVNQIDAFAKAVGSGGYLVVIR